MTSSRYVNRGFLMRGLVLVGIIVCAVFVFWDFGDIDPVSTGSIGKPVGPKPLSAGDFAKQESRDTGSTAQSARSKQGTSESDGATSGRRGKFEVFVDESVITMDVKLLDDGQFEVRVGNSDLTEERNIEFFVRRLQYATVTRVTEDEGEVFIPGTRGEGWFVPSQIGANWNKDAGPMVSEFSAETGKDETVIRYGMAPFLEHVSKVPKRELSSSSLEIRLSSARNSKIVPFAEVALGDFPAIIDEVSVLGEQDGS